jgi:hypothetical protein
MQPCQVRFRRFRRISMTFGIRAEDESSMRCLAAIIDVEKRVGGAGLL